MCSSVFIIFTHLISQLTYLTLIVHTPISTCLFLASVGGISTKVLNPPKPSNCFVFGRELLFLFISCTYSMY